MFDVMQIREILPHRFPFLLVDRIVSWERGKGMVGIKNVTINEPFFTGHFPEQPVMPGVLIIEALAQVGGVFALKELGCGMRISYFTGIDNAKFKRQVVPGDQLRLEVTFTARKGTFWKIHGEAKVDGVLAAKADMTAMIPEGEDAPAPEGRTR